MNLLIIYPSKLKLGSAYSWEGKNGYERNSLNITLTLTLQSITSAPLFSIRERRVATQVSNPTTVTSNLKTENEWNLESKSFAETREEHRQL